jgi:hypothetical protein
MPKNSQLSALNSESDANITPTYVKVLLLEAAIVAALWIAGRWFA